MRNWFNSLQRGVLLCASLLFFSSIAFADNLQPLPIDKAFQLSVDDIHDNSVQLHWTIAPGYHLYRDNFSFKNPNVGRVNLPPGIPKQDDILGKYQVYENSLDLVIPFNKVEKGSNILWVTYQGCSDKNFCYPPITKKITVDFQDITQVNVQTHDKASAVTMQDKVMNLLQEKNYFLICLAFIGFGLLLAFTPCVLPMIPILSGIIVGQDKTLTTRQAFFLSLSYVVGMSLSYAMAGVLVALAGSHLSEIFQTPWVIIVFSLLFVLLALSLFGFYDLQLPNFLHHRIVNISNKQKSGSYIGAVMMGALSVLIVSPCITAPLVGVLTFIAQTGDVILGSTALFALGLGMGIPLLIIGTTEGKFLPKSGPWMNVVKSAFGVLLIAVAIYLLQRIVPGSISLMLWAALLIVLAVYLGVGSHHRSVSSGWIKFGKGLGLLFFCYGVILLVGTSMGNTDPLRPLKINSTVSSVQSDTLNFQRVKNLSDVQAMVNQARQQGKSVVLDFYADWCVSCHEMDRNTFADPAVIAKLKDVVLIRADVTANDQTDRALQDYFNVIAPPSLLFFDKQGKELTKFRLVGGMSPKDFLEHLHLVY